MFRIIKMVDKKKISVTTRQQLLDLNGTTTNFDLTFQAKSKNNEPFEMLIVDQTTLDNNPNLEFKNVDGIISGNIISDKNVYQNYFMCLKAKKNCEVEITIDKKEIPPKAQINKYKDYPKQQQVKKRSQMESSKWKFILFVLAIGIVVGLLFFYKSNKSSPTEELSNLSSLATPYSSKNLTLPTRNSYFSFGDETINGGNTTPSLTDRLNNLSI